MAKGIRSKVARRNRTLLRKTIMEPIQNHRQLVLSKKQKKYIEYKKQTTLTGLIDTLSSNVKVKQDDEMEENSDVDENEDNDENNNEDVEIPKLELKSDYVDKTVKRYNRNMSWLK